MFKELNVSTGLRVVLGTSTSNGAGVATLPYTIPTDTSKTNITIEVYFNGDGDYMASKASKIVVFSP